MQLDITQVPFSRRGSYLSVFHQPQSDAFAAGLYLRAHHAPHAGQRTVMKLVLLLDGRPARHHVRASAGVLTIASASDPHRRVHLCLDGNTVVLTGRHAGLRLIATPGKPNIAQWLAPNRWSVNLRRSRCRFMVSTTTGSIQADCPWQPRGSSRMILDLMTDQTGALEGFMDMYQSTWMAASRPGFQDTADAAIADFQRWLDQQPAAPASLQSVRERAAYVTWSTMIPAGGLLQRPTMLMSKATMDSIWSWDHCFSAMALSFHAPDLALDQWLVMFDRQDSYGALPDSVNPANEHFNFSKPPVHGWALQFMMNRQPRFFATSKLKQVYTPLSRWTMWWLKHRVAPGDALPHYLHGNDSGWDNATMFDGGAPLVTPDLAAFLAYQAGTLGVIAGKLGKPRQAERWHHLQRQLTKALIDELWRDDHFVARRVRDNREITTQSLVFYMPIILGPRLPPAVSQTLVRRLPEFLTRWGLASEKVSSRHYTPDGYWRGPIWAPTTLIAYDGLRSLGQHQLANTLARRFCRLCATHGFYENFNAVSGQGLRDPSLAWTPSVFLILAHELTRRRP